MWDRKELKARGMAAFKANYWRTVLVCFLLSFFVLGGSASIGGIKDLFDDDLGKLYSLNGLGQNGASQSVPYIAGGTTADSMEEAIRRLRALDALDDLEDLDDFLPEDFDPDDPEDWNELESELGGAVGSFFSSQEGKAAVVIAAVIFAIVILIVFAVGSALRVFVFNPLEAGCQNFLVRNAAGESDLGDLAFGFTPDYWRNVKTLFLRDLFRLLWGLLLIVPGIIKRYAYRMAPYILADHPELSGTEVLTLSRRMMDGHKWNAFVLDLSFLGWNILSCLTFGMLGIFYVNPYRHCTNAELYRVLKGA